MVAILVRFEKVVLDESLPMYLRAYAWLKFISFWGSLQGEDSTWVDPRELFYDAGVGIRGRLL